MTEIQSIPTNPRFKDLTGQSFADGRLTVIGYHGATTQPCGNKRHLWLVRCECGNEKTMEGNNLKSGNSSSCGCFQKQATSILHRTHGMSKTRTYKIWAGMIKRCTNEKCKSYDRYGGRGIKVCDRWLTSFDNFLADMGSAPLRMSIDRFPDNNGNYEPGNCRWATVKQQNSNTRRTRNLEFRGETLPIAIWAKRIGVHEQTLFSRINNGWSIEDALTIKPMRGNRHSKSSSKTSA